MPHQLDADGPMPHQDSTTANPEGSYSSDFDSYDEDFDEYVPSDDEAREQRDAEDNRQVLNNYRAQLEAPLPAATNVHSTTANVADGEIMALDTRIERMRSKCIAHMGAENFWKAFDYLSEARDQGRHETTIRKHLISTVGYEAWHSHCFDVDQLVILMQISKDNRAAPNSAGQQVSSPVRYYKADRDRSLPYASTAESSGHMGSLNSGSLNSSSHRMLASDNEHNDKSGHARDSHPREMSPPGGMDSISPVGRPPGRQGRRVIFNF